MPLGSDLTVSHAGAEDFAGQRGTELKDELLEYYRNSRLTLLAAIEGLSDEQLSEPSLDGWSVKDHLAHVALWDELRGAEVERISAGYESAWKTSEEQSDAYNELGYALRKNLSPRQVLWELERSRGRLLRAIEGSTPDGLDGTLYGEAGLRSDHELEHAGWIKEWRQRTGR